MTNEQRLAMMKVCDEVARERIRQHERWGEQSLPDGTGGDEFGWGADMARVECEDAVDDGYVTFRHVLAEEVAEAFAESDPEKLRAELVQVAACAIQWVEAIDRRKR